MEFGAFLKRFVGAALPALVVAGAGFSATGANAQNLEVYLSPPAVQNTVVSGALIETFERGPGSIGASGTWNIGNYTASTGSYDAAGVYGGAGRTGYYLGVHTGPINVAVAPGYQYLGFWWSAGDASNIITFYDEHGVQLIRFTTADINALLSGTGTVPTVGGGTYPKASFFGNPNPPGGNTGEPYAYVNLILTNTTSTFGSIKIEGSNFELDNLSIAYPTSPQSNWVPVTTYPVALAAVNDAYATPAGQTVSGNVSTNDATPSVGVTPTYAVVTNVSHGTLTLNSSTGAFSYTPNAGFTGVDTFTYNRCRTDAPTVCSLATVTITVFDAVNDTNSTLAGQTVTGNAASNDAFPVGSTFSGPTSSTNGGTVSMNADGTYSYTPAPGFSGVDTFNYSLCLPSPNQAICDTATVSIGVRPDAVNDTGSTMANTPLSSSVTGNDVGVQTGSTFSKASDPAHGTVTVNSDGSYVYTPTAGYAGPDSFTYQVCLPSPNQTLCDTATVNLTVRPDAVNDTASTMANTPLSSSVAGNDVGVQAGSTFSKATDPAHGTVTVNPDGSYTYTPTNGYAGPDSFTYQVCLPSPNQTLCDTATVSIGVRPDAVNDAGSTMANTPLSSSVAGNDVGVQPGSTFSKASDPAHGTVTVNSDGTYTYTPTNGYAGPDSFTYQVCLPSPNQTLCDTATVTLTARPDAVDDSAVTPMNTALNGSVSGNDIGVQPNSTFSKASDPAHGTVTVNADGTYVYTPTAGYTGTDSFTYQVCLPSPNQTICDTATVNVTVFGAVNDQAVTNVDTPVSGNAATNDLGVPANSTYTKATDPAHGTVTMNADGTYTYTPAAGYSGLDSFTYQVCPPSPNQTHCSTATVSINVLAAVNDQAVTTVDTPVSGNVATNDGTVPPGATFSKAADPAHGTVVVNADGTYTYTPSPGYSGADSFTYRLCTADTPPVCTTATVDLFVMKAVDDQLGAVPGARIPGNLASNDTVPPGSTFSGPVSGPSHGTVTVNADGTYTYQSDPGYLGNDSFTYQVCAPAVGAAAPVCTTATVRVLVQQPAPVPTLSQWALMLLAGLMALGAARRRNA